MYIGLSFTQKGATKSWIQYQRLFPQNLRRIFVATLQYTSIIQVKASYCWLWNNRIYNIANDNFIKYIIRNSHQYFPTEYLCQHSSNILTLLIPIGFDLLTHINTYWGQKSKPLYLLNDLGLKKVSAKHQIKCWYCQETPHVTT